MKALLQTGPSAHVPVPPEKRFLISRRRYSSLWVAQKIYKLINDHLASGRAKTIQEIRDLSTRHNVPLPSGVDFPM